MEERSAGAVVYRDDPSGRRYLLLVNAKRWDFPKGGIEKGETEPDTALREVREETGISGLELLPGFRHVVEYFYKRDGKTIHKRVFFYLGRAGDDKVRISDEHQGFGWYGYKDALQRTSYENSKRVLEAAEVFLNSDLRAAPAGASGKA